VAAKLRIELPPKSVETLSFEPTQRKWGKNHSLMSEAAWARRGKDGSYTVFESKVTAIRTAHKIILMNVDIELALRKLNQWQKEKEESDQWKFIANAQHMADLNYAGIAMLMGINLEPDKTPTEPAVKKFGLN